ncbi:MAG: co-chaperone GroES [Geodermatophilaceae bacterium]|nr:co-chaperone GroES [Geodermatophilaceae bacterium]
MTTQITQADIDLAKLIRRAAVKLGEPVEPQIEALADATPTSLSTREPAAPQAPGSAPRRIPIPLEDRIVIQPNEPDTVTASGLVIPDTGMGMPQEGTVIAIGPGRIDDKGNRMPLDVSVGDRVIYSKYGGTEIRYADEDYLVLAARDLLAITDSVSASSATSL